MQDKIMRKFLLGFMQIHILDRAKQSPFYGSWMIEELRRLDYEMSPGTLYPLLRSLESSGLLTKEDRVVEGRVRKYYAITEEGLDVLKEARKKAYDLFKEVHE